MFPEGRVRPKGSIVGRLCPYVGGFLVIKAFYCKNIGRRGISTPVLGVETHFSFSIFFSSVRLGKHLIFMGTQIPLGDIIVGFGCRGDACLNNKLL